MTSRFFQISPYLIIIVIGFFLMARNGELHHLQYEIENLILKELTIEVVNNNGETIKNVRFSMAPEYSFQEIKPKFYMVPLAENKIRIVIASSNKSLLTLGAPGYLDKTMKIENTSPSNMQLILHESNVK